MNLIMFLLSLLQESGIEIHTGKIQAERKVFIIHLLLIRLYVHSFLKKYLT